MKLKFIKSILIGDCKFKVIWDKKSSGGEFRYPWENEKGFIRIGTSKHKVNPIRTLSIINNELKEIIQTEQLTRVKKGDEQGYEFHYTHKEHTDFCARLAGLLNEFIK
mgnify:CR=1 FL=1